MINYGFATSFGLEAPTVEELVKLTLANYETAIRHVHSYLAEDKLEKYLYLITCDLESVSLGRMRKLLREAGFGFTQHLQNIDIFAVVGAPFLLDVDEMEAFLTENSLNTLPLIEERDGTIQLNYRDFLDSNSLVYGSYLNYIRILNIYCALTVILNESSVNKK
ncbi:MAG: hypothetical protein ACRC6X_04980 [Culicoidibacterales bacterium]